MRFSDKMFKLTPRMIKLIEKQLKKEKVEVKSSWHKNFLCLISETDEGDTFFTLFNRKTKDLYTTCTIYNEKDTFDSYLGETIAINRMGKHQGFKDSVSINLNVTFMTINGNSITTGDILPTIQHYSDNRY